MLEIIGMIRTRGRGRLPTTAPATMPPPQANTMETATSYSVTASAWPYSPASFQPAAIVEDSEGRKSSGITPARGSASHSMTREITIRRRSVVGDIEMLMPIYGYDARYGRAAFRRY